MMLLQVMKYQIDLIVLIIIVPVIIFFLLLTTWAVFDIAKHSSLSRERKFILTNLVKRWPIYGVLLYIFKERPAQTKH